MKEEGKIKMAYAAGIMDGDGSFSLIRRKEVSAASPRHYPLLQLCNMSEKLVKRFVDWFGGGISVTKNRVYKDGKTRQIVFTWRSSAKEICRDFLKGTIPFLQIKKERAQFLLDFLDSNPNVKGSNRVDEKIIAMRDAASAQMRRFNEFPLLNLQANASSAFLDDPSCAWAYIAGLMDSDGSFSISRTFVCDGEYARYRPTVQLTMYDCRGVIFVRQIMPNAKITVIKAKTCKSGIAFKVMLQKRHEVKEFLKSIFPFIFVKKESVKILMEFCDCVSTENLGRTGISFDEMALRNNLYQQLIESNKHGVSKPSLIDLEACPPTENGDKAEGTCHRERLSERAS